MQALEANVQALYRARRKGASMAMAIAASFLLFSLGILSILSTSRLLDAAGEKLPREQCRVLAISFADVVRGELEQGDTALCAYAAKQLASGAPFRVVSIGTEETIFLTVRLGKALPRTLPAGSFFPEETEETLRKVDEITVPCLEFALETTVTYQGQRYTCEDPYVLAERYQAVYRAAGEIVSWRGEWQRGDGTAVEDATPIFYSYDETEILGYCFVPGWGGTP